MAKIDIGFSLSPWQKLVDASSAKTKLIRAGRRAGKSKYGIKWILDGATKPNSKNWIVAPTARQGKDIFWHDIINILEGTDGKIIKRKNAMLCDVTLINNAQIGIRGSNVAENLRGNGLDRLFLDEYAYHKAMIWEKILRPQLIDKKGSVIFSSSPRGHNHFKKMEEYIKEQVKIYPKDYALFYHTIYDNPFLDKAYIEKEKSGCSDDVWNQEYLAQYIDWVGIIYHECDLERHVFNPQEIHNDYKLHPYVKGLDWGMEDGTACIWLHIKDNKILVSDEYNKNNVDPATHYKVISAMDMGRHDQNKYNVLDKTAFRRESSGRSVAQQFSELGLRPLSPSSGTLDYGINLIKRLFNTGQLLISTHCQKVLQSVIEWEHGQHEPDVLAAMRYGIIYAVEKQLITVNDDIKNMKHDRDSGVRVSGGIVRVRPHRDEGWNYEDGSPNEA